MTRETVKETVLAPIERRWQEMQCVCKQGKRLTSFMALLNFFK
jgi:hypothetical protein